jgi:hypothetical protein
MGGGGDAVFVLEEREDVLSYVLKVNRGSASILRSLTLYLPYADVRSVKADARWSGVELLYHFTDFRCYLLTKAVKFN